MIMLKNAINIIRFIKMNLYKCIMKPVIIPKHRTWVTSRLFGANPVEVSELVLDAQAMHTEPVFAATHGHPLPSAPPATAPCSMRCVS